MNAKWRGELGETLNVAAPLAAAQLGYMVMATTDTVMMGKISTDALAAGGLSSAVGMMLVYVALGFLQSIQPIVAQSRGADDPRALPRTFAGGLVAGLLCAIPIMVLLLRLEPILNSLGEPPLVARLAGDYARAFDPAVPGILLAGALRNYLTACERTGFVMAVSVCALPLNLFLNWALIFGRFGAPALGLPGSGWATSLVAWAMTVALAIHLYLAKLLPFGLSRLSPRELARGARDVFGLGFPIALQWLLEIGMFSCSSIVMGRFGPVALAAHQICINLVSLTYTVPSAISTAATVRVGFHIGARAPADARISGFVALALGVMFMAAVAVVLNLFARPILALYLDPADPLLPRVQTLGISLLTVAALFQVFDGTQCVAAGALRGLMEVRVPLIAAFVGYWVLGLPLGFALAVESPLGPVGIWCGLAIGLVLVATALATHFYFRAERRVAELSAIGANVGMLVDKLATLDPYVRPREPIAARRSTSSATRWRPAFERTSDDPL